MPSYSDPRVVLVHDWLTGMRGGEKVLEVLCRRWPQAELFTLLHRKGLVCPAIEELQPHTSFLQRFPGVHNYYRYLLPLMPLAARWRIPACDLVVSSSHCVAKSAMPPPGVPHVCYCYTPMRYAWHMRSAYFGAGRKSLKAWAQDRLLAWLRDWDRRTAERVTHFIAISETVRDRIRDCYDRPSTVIYPPVDTDYYTPAPVPRQDFYLVMSAFAPYKRLDLAILACNRLRKNLLVIGTGQDEKRLRSLAGPTVRFLGWQPDEVIRDHYRRCRALLFPGEEDFGIVPLEAHACGAPVIAFARGGATETVIPPKTLAHASGSDNEATGLWFAEQTVECLIAALAEFEREQDQFNPAVARRQALRFNKRRFASELFGFLAEVLEPSAESRRRAA
jgi:glycosyltransferase involved in cell wall biosynthesis